MHQKTASQLQAVSKNMPTANMLTQRFIIDKYDSLPYKMHQKQSCNYRLHQTTCQYVDTTCDHWHIRRHSTGCIKKRADVLLTLHMYSADRQVHFTIISTVHCVIISTGIYMILTVHWVIISNNYPVIILLDNTNCTSYDNNSISYQLDTPISSVHFMTIHCK